MAADNVLPADQIAQRGFTVGFRGFDQVEVREFLGRVAEGVRALQSQLADLDAARREAEERAARPPVLDEDTLMAAVGEETAAILRTARAAAADLRTRAEQESARAVDEARVQAAELRAEAEARLGEATREAEEAARHILAEAREQAAGLVESARAEAAAALDAARQEADAIRAAADEDRRLTIEGATATREKILADLSRRRRVATVQIEQLRAGRERLLESYGVVRRTLEEVNDELQRADAEARAAAEDAGRRFERELPADGLPLEADDRGPDDRGPGGATPPPGALGAGDAAAEAGSKVDELFARISAAQPAEDVSAGAPPAVEAGEAPAAVDAPVPEGSGTGAPPAAGVAAAPAGEGPADAEAAPPGEPAPPPGPEAGADVEEGDAGEGAGHSEAEEALLEQRDRVVADLEVSLTRKLKRALQDEQNDVLDRLRGLRGEPSPDALIPSPEAQVERLARAARPLLARALDAGGSFARAALDLPATRARTADSALGALATAGASAIAEPLRRRLERAIEASAGDEQQVLVEAIGAAYREWKSQRVERIAGDVLTEAFARGTWQAAPDGTLLRWIVEDLDGPCPDCDDDGLAGTLPKGEEFPTGQHYPPAHSGCRCLLVPVPA